MERINKRNKYQKSNRPDKSTSNFFIASKNFLQIIKTGVDHMSSEVWDVLGKQPYNIYIKTTKPRQVFLVRHEDSKLIKDIKNKDIIQHTGIFFGNIKEEEFMVSLEGAEFLYNLNFDKEMGLKIISLDLEGSKSFMYGNSQKPETFKKSPKELNRKDLIFVTNYKNQFIGIGFIFKKYQPRARNKKEIPEKPDRFKKPEKKDSDELILRNLTDYGYYIRRGF